MSCYQRQRDWREGARQRDRNGQRDSSASSITRSPRRRRRRASTTGEVAYSKESSAVGALVYDLDHYPVTTASMIRGTSVLDPPAPIPPSRKHLAAIFGAAGFFASLALGLGVVIIGAVTSNRLRRRDDVAQALGAPVKLSVGKVRPLWAPGQAAPAQRRQQAAAADRRAPARRRRRWQHGARRRTGRQRIGRRFVGGIARDLVRTGGQARSPGRSVHRQPGRAPARGERARHSRGQRRRDFADRRRSRALRRRPGGSHQPARAVLAAQAGEQGGRRGVRIG